MPLTLIARSAPPSEISPHGYILFVREQTLTAQPVDPDSLQPAGDVFPVIEQVSSIPNTGYSLYSISRNGIILHLSGSAEKMTGNRTFVQPVVGRPDFISVQRGKQIQSRKT